MSHEIRDEFDHDEPLRALLRTADPAATLPAAEPRTLAGVLDAVTADDQGHGPRRGVGTWLVAAAAAAVVVVAGVGAVRDARSGDTTTVSRPAGGTTTPAAPTSTSASPAVPGSSSDTATPSTTVLTVSPDAFQARCAVPNAALLQQTDTAFAGTVRSIRGTRVTLQRSDTYRGQVTDTVVVRAPRSDISRLVQTVKFEVGGDYLISASGGQVALCGFTGPAQTSLQGIYAEAFPR